MIARCNTVLAGEDVFTEEELVALEALGRQAEGLAEAVQKARETLAAKKT